MTVLNIKYVWKWEIDIIFQMLIGKFVWMRLTSVALTSWISLITSKISWIVSRLALIKACVCVCGCASVYVCNWFYNLIYGPQKQILVFCFCLEIWILAWGSHGKMPEFFSEIFCGTQCHSTTRQGFHSCLYVCNWFYNLIYGPQKQILVFCFCLEICILAWGSHGKMPELSSDFLWDAVPFNYKTWVS